MIMAYILYEWPLQNGYETAVRYNGTQRNYTTKPDYTTDTTVHGTLHYDYWQLLTLPLARSHLERVRTSMPAKKRYSQSVILYDRRRKRSARANST